MNDLTVTTIDFGSVMGSSEAARALGISKGHLLRLANAGRIEAAVTPIGRLFERAEVERLAAERSNDQAAA